MELDRKNKCGTFPEGQQHLKVGLYFPVWPARPLHQVPRCFKVPPCHTRYLGTQSDIYEWYGTQVCAVQYYRKVPRYDGYIHN